MKRIFVIICLFVVFSFFAVGTYPTTTVSMNIENVIIGLTG